MEYHSSPAALPDISAIMEKQADMPNPYSILASKVEIGSPHHRSIEAIIDYCLLAGELRHLDGSSLFLGSMGYYLRSNSIQVPQEI